MFYNSNLLKKVRAHLAHGGIIAYPTESCFGFGCDPRNYKAINKILKLKGRTKNKGLIIIAGEIDQLRGLVTIFTNNDLQELDKYWPGFYSIILTSTPSVLPNLIGKHNKIAARVTKHHLVKQLCNTNNSALVSTSANKSGFKSIKTYRECVRQFGQKDNTNIMILPGNTYFKKKPSTIIDWETGKFLRR